MTRNYCLQILLLLVLSVYSKDIQSMFENRHPNVDRILDTLFLHQLNKNNGWRIKSEVREEWYNNSWYSKKRWTHSYNDSLVRTFMEKWDYGAQKWLVSQVHKNKLTHRKKIKEYAFKYWSTSNAVWVPTPIDFLSYDNKGSLTVLETYDRRDTINIGDLTRKTKFTNVYSQNELLFESYYSKWDIENNIWVDSISKYEYKFYPSSNQLENVNVYAWNDSLNEWDLKVHYQREYDNSNELSSYISHYWDKEKQEWIIPPNFSFKFDNTYDSVGNINEVIIRKYNNLISQFENYKRIQISHERISNPIINNVKNRPTQKLNVLMTNRDIIINKLPTSTNSIRIFNIQGKELFKSSILFSTNNIKISRDLFSNAGVFILKVTCDEMDLSQKIYLK